ncbi:MAG TPA: alpha/beta fold hydrolase [Reyranella sp.]|nr:alpha/beta fold hydrolase [Reyranella sp.]
MSSPAATLAPPSAALMLMEGRALPEFSAFWLMRPWLSVTARGDGHPVLVVPGLLADDTSTRALRGFLNSHGYKAHGWKQGRNRGLQGTLEADMLARIEELFARHGGRKVSLVGWSLGGLYARQLAKLAPDKVRCMISLGSPFAGSPRSTNAWRAYEWANGSTADDQMPAGLAEVPPVPTTSIFSRTDGICAWQGCLNPDGPASENIEVDGSHCGLGHHPAVVYAIADRLAQPEGAWKKFERRGWRALVFPDWRRA